MYRIENVASSLINLIEYDEDTEALIVLLSYGDIKKHYVDKKTFSAFITADSIGAYYNKYIKNNFKKSKKETTMSDLQINLKINVDEIVSAWIFKGEKGRYLNMTLFYNKDKDTYGNNGMIVQQVPSEIYKAELKKGTKMKSPILGNASVFERKVDEETKPGVESGTMLGANVADDEPLPF